MDTHQNLQARLFKYAEQLGFGELHFKLDHDTGLFAIVAVHSTKLGPALGGCRCIEYETINEAMRDVLRLAQGMSYKAALANLQLGGGKAVIPKPKEIKDRKAYFEAFGEFVETLGGRYITAVDSGTSPYDMDIIATKTKHVTSTTDIDGDPSPFTAHGVCRSVQAAVKHKLGHDSLDGLHVAIQGVGHVGRLLAHELHSLGARLTVTDVNEENLKYCVEQFNAQVVHPDEIYAVDCDVFSPCALGASINDDTIPQLKCSIIVGAANNQLAESRHGSILLEKGILYAPDFVVNSGGLIYACAQYYKLPKKEVHQKVDKIYDTLLEIFTRSDEEKRATSIIADEVALERLNKGE